jgi:hypothetical protein
LVRAPICPRCGVKAEQCRAYRVAYASQEFVPFYVDTDQVVVWETRCACGPMLRVTLMQEKPPV